MGTIKFSKLICHLHFYFAWSFQWLWPHSKMMQYAQIMLYSTCIWVPSRLKLLPTLLIFNDAWDGIFQLWETIPCPLTPWLLKLPEHQQEWYWQYRIASFAPLSTWSSSVKQNPRCYRKCEYSFHNLQNNSACQEFMTRGLYGMIAWCHTILAKKSDIIWHQHFNRQHFKWIV